MLEVPIADGADQHVEQLNVTGLAHGVAKLAAQRTGERRHIGRDEGEGLSGHGLSSSVPIIADCRGRCL